MTGTAPLPSEHSERMRKLDYNQQLQQKFDAMIEGLAIAPLQKEYL
jgi:hypothetical protein